MADDTRVPYNPIDEVPIRPVAEEVDAYVQPQKAQDLGPNMEALAKGFRDFSAGLDGFLGGIEKQQNDANELRGERDAYLKSSGGEALGVASGPPTTDPNTGALTPPANTQPGYVAPDPTATNANGTPQGLLDGLFGGGGIFAQHSPSYTKGYGRVQGSIAGQDLETKFHDAYMKAGAGSMDDAAFSAFQRGFVRSNLSNNDPNFLRGALPHVRDIMVKSQDTHNHDRDAYLRAQNQAATGAEISMSTSRGVLDGAGSPAGFDVAKNYAQLMAIRQTQLSTGNMQPGFDEQRGWDKSYVDAITAKAMGEAKSGQGLQILGMLQQQVPGTNYTYADTTYGQTKFREASDHLHAYERQETTEGHKLQAEADKVEKDNALRSMYDQISKDPNSFLTEDQLARGSKFDPAFRKKAAEWQKTVRENSGFQDPQTELHIQQDIVRGGGQAALDQAQANKLITSPEAHTRLRNLATDFEKNRDGTTNMLSDPAFKAYERTATQRLGDANSVTINGEKGDNAQSLSMKGAMAQAVLTWNHNNPNASPMERRKAIDDIGMTYVKSLPDPDLSGSPAAPVDQNALSKITGPAPIPGTPGGPTTATAPMDLSTPVAPQGAAGAAADVPVPASPSQQAAPSPAADQQPGGADPAATGAPVTLPEVTGPAVMPKGDRVQLPGGMRYADGSQGGPGTGASPLPAPAPAPAYPRKSIPAPGADFKRPEVGTFYRTLTPEQRTQLTQQAAKVGMSPEQSASVLYDNGVKMGVIKPSMPPAPPQAPQATPIAPQGGPMGSPTLAPTKVSAATDEVLRALDNGSMQPTEDMMTRARQGITAALMGDNTQPTQGGYTVAALRDDPRAAKILDFIGNAELAAGKGGMRAANYNAYYGHADSQMDLSKMSLADVQHWMNTRGTVSSATGRYQFMGYTLFGRRGAPGLVQEMGLSMNDKFTPELQDRMAIKLLQRRGYDRWRAGKMSTSDFADSLAKEWASLPMFSGPKAGRSAYAGDGLNKSLVTQQKVVDALEGSTAGIQPPDRATALAPAQAPGTAAPAVAAITNNLKQAADDRAAVAKAVAKSRKRKTSEED